VAAKRLSMRTIKEVLRLRAQGLSDRAIGRSLKIPRTTVRRYRQRAEDAGVGWPLPAGLTESALEAQLFPPSPPVGRYVRPEPDLPRVHRELRRRGVTLQLLWLEYKAQHPEGYQYSRFCDLFREWKRALDPVLRQEHRAGEKVLVDYAGQTMPIVDRETGRGSRRSDFRRRPRCQQLHLCRGHLEPEPSRLDRVACPDVRVLPGSQRIGRARQPELGRGQGLSLRTGREPYLPGTGHPLRDRRTAHEAQGTSGQGEGGDGSSNRGTMGPGPPSQPHLLLPGRTQPGDPPLAGSPQ